MSLHPPRQTLGVEHDKLFPVLGDGLNALVDGLRHDLGDVPGVELPRRLDGCLRPEGARRSCGAVFLHEFRGTDGVVCACLVPTSLPTP